MSQEINQFLDQEERSVRSIFVSSFIPRKCGIATFTKDLVRALNDLNSDTTSEIIAVNNGDAELEYPWDVKYRIFHDKLDSYYQAAEYVNQSSADIICLQHEFGLYGGDLGDYVFNFMRNINKPLITTFHTILQDPDDKHKEILQRLAEVSRFVVAMIPDAKERLARDYNIDRNKVVVIHHGVSNYDKTQTIKIPARWKGRPTLLLSGLISRNKGVEYVIKALPAIRKHYPEINFVVAGQTHPEVKKHEGESYRYELIRLAKHLGVYENVAFVNRYLALHELLDYYEFCDAYLTPHVDTEQITSGTLAYALGMGKACISTPYPYAKEMLSDGRGILVGYRNHKEIADGVIGLLKNNDMRLKMENEAFRLGRKMRWPRVAERYLNLFRYIAHD